MFNVKILQLTRKQNNSTTKMEKVIVHFIFAFLPVTVVEPVTVVDAAVVLSVSTKNEKINKLIKCKLLLE